MNGMTKAIMLVLGFALIFGVVSAAPGGGAQVVKLVAKNSADWSIVKGGAFGSIMYQTDKFTFNAHGLTPSGEYTLINYVDPWGSENVILATGVADGNGNILLKGGAITLNPNEAGQGGYDYAGSKIWLVPSGDLNGGVKFIAWNPDSYLFETSLII